MAAVWRAVERQRIYTEHPALQSLWTYSHREKGGVMSELKSHDVAVVWTEDGEIHGTFHYSFKNGFWSLDCWRDENSINPTAEGRLDALCGLRRRHRHYQKRPVEKELA